MHTALIAAGVMQRGKSALGGTTAPRCSEDPTVTRRNSSELATMLLMNNVTEHKPALVVACGSTQRPLSRLQVDDRIPAGDSDYAGQKVWDSKTVSTSDSKFGLSCANTHDEAERVIP